MGDLSDRFDVGNFQCGIRYRLAENGARFVIDRRSEIVRIIGINKRHIDAELWQDVFELCVGATVEVTCGDNVVALFRESDDRVKNRRGARGQRQSCGTMLHRCETLL